MPIMTLETMKSYHQNSRGIKITNNWSYVFTRNILGQVGIIDLTFMKLYVMQKSQ